LDENLIRPITTFDEVHTRLATFMTMRVDRNIGPPSLVRPSSLARRRPARTPPSTFLFLQIHFSNSPGRIDPAPNRRAGEARVSDDCRRLAHRASVRSIAGASSHRRGGRRAVTGRI